MSSTCYKYTIYSQNFSIILIYHVHNDVFSEKPSKPYNLKDIAVTRSTVTIQWQPPREDGGAPLKYYLIEKKEATRSNWTRVDKITPDITSYCVQNLIEGNEYFFRVYAENSVSFYKLYQCY